MTYKEIETRLKKCETILTSIKNGTYKELKNQDPQEVVKQVNVLKESLTKRLLEMETGTITVHKKDKKTATDLAKQGYDVELKTEQEDILDGDSLDEESTKRLMVAVTPHLEAALKDNSLEVHNKKGKVTAPGKFYIRVTFKNGTDKTYEFRVENNELFIEGRAQRLGDIKRQEDGSVQIHGEVVANELSKHIKGKSLEEGASQSLRNIYKMIERKASAHSKNTLEERESKFKEGDRVRIDREYGGGTGTVDYTEGSFVVLKNKGSYHESNLTLIKSANNEAIQETEKEGKIKPGTYAGVAVAVHMNGPQTEWKVEFIGDSKFGPAGTIVDYADVIANLKFDDDTKSTDYMIRRDASSDHPQLEEPKTEALRRLLKKQVHKILDELYGGEGDDLHYIKVHRFDYRKAEPIIKKAVYTFNEENGFYDTDANDEIKELKLTINDPGPNDDAYTFYFAFDDSATDKDKQELFIEELEDALLRVDISLLGRSDGEEDILERRKRKISFEKALDYRRLIPILEDLIKAYRLNPELAAQHGFDFKAEEARLAKMKEELEYYDLNEGDGEDILAKKYLQEDEANNLLKQDALSPAEYQKAKKLKGFDSKNYKWDKNQDLYIIRKMSEDYDAVKAQKEDGREKYIPWPYEDEMDGGATQGQLDDEENYERGYHKDLPLGEDLDLEHHDEAGMEVPADDHDDLDLGHQDDEPHMLKKEVYDIAVYAAKLYKQLKKYDAMDGEVDFPHWWQRKVTLAREYMSKAQHYLEFEEKEPMIDQLALEGKYKKGELKENIEDDRKEFEDILTRIKDRFETARTVEKLREELDNVINTMKNIAKLYKTVKGTPDQDDIVKLAKKATMLRDRIQKEYDDEVARKGADQEYDSSVNEEKKEQDWPPKVSSHHKGEYEYRFKEKMKDGRAKYKIVDLENNEKIDSIIIFDTVDELKDHAGDKIKPQGGRQSTHLGEGKKTCCGRCGQVHEKKGNCTRKKLTGKARCDA